MAHRPFIKFGRFGLAACAVSLAVASLSAQTAPSTTGAVVLGSVLWIFAGPALLARRSAS